MSLALTELCVVRYPTVITSETTLLHSAKSIDGEECSVRHGTATCDPVAIVQGDVSSSGPIIIYFGQYQSTLRTALIHHLTNTDVTLILFSSEDYLWRWFDANPSVMVASLVLQSTAASMQRLINRSRDYDGVHSVLVRCASPDILSLQRFCRSFARVDGIFDDDVRLLVKLFIDLALFSEELGDQRRHDENNEIEAQRNYDRALMLCALVKKI